MSWLERQLDRLRGLLTLALALLSLWVTYQETPLVPLVRAGVNFVLRTEYAGPSPLASFHGPAGPSYDIITPLEPPVVGPDVAASDVVGPSVVASDVAAPRCLPRAELVSIAGEHRVAPAHLLALLETFAVRDRPAVRPQKGLCRMELPANLVARSELLSRGRCAEGPCPDVPLTARSLAKLLAAEQEFFAISTLSGELAIEALLLDRGAVVSAANAAHAAGTRYPYTLEQHRRLLPAPLSASVDHVMWVLAQARLGQMTWPTKGSFPVTSPFGERTHPMLGGRQLHDGIDLSMPVGTPLAAVLPGTVSRVGEDSICGRFLRVSHGYGIESVYCHLSRVQVAASQRVSRGQLIASSGNSGRSTGPHLHLSLRLRGKAVDPLAWYRRGFGH